MEVNMPLSIKSRKTLFIPLEKNVDNEPANIQEPTIQIDIVLIYPHLVYLIP